MRRLPSCSPTSLAASSLAALTLAALAGCSSAEKKDDAAPTSSNVSAESAGEEDETEPTAAPLPNEGAPFKGLVTAGQPSEDDLKAAKARGFTVVVNARTPGEAGRLQNERAIVEGLGMTYYEIPVEKDPDALTEEQSGALARIVADHGTEGLLLHCSSGNRASSLLALYLVTHGGLSADEAMAIGKKAGVTRWEAAMAEKLQALKGETTDADVP